MDNSKTVACVTGASGMVGSKIVRRLVSHGYKVIALSRSNYFDDPDVELFRSGLEDEIVLKLFLSKVKFFSLRCCKNMKAAGASDNPKKRLYPRFPKGKTGGNSSIYCN